MDFRKTHFPVFVPQVPEAIYVEERKLVPLDNGGYGVHFIPVDTQKICDSCLDPREITLQSCIESNCFIQPTDVQRIFNLTDKSDIENLAGSISETNYKWIVENEENFDFDKNTIVESVKSE